MPMSERDIVKVQNLEEHIRVLKGNLDVVVNQLSRKTEELNIARYTLSGLQIDVDAARSLLARTQSEAAAIRDELTKKEQLSESRIEAAREAEEAVKNARQELFIWADGELARVEAEKHLAAAHIQDLNVTKSAIQADLDDVQQRLQASQERFNELDSNIVSAQNILSALQAETADQRQEHEKECIRFKVELAQAQAELDARKEELQTRLDILETREAQVTTREEDAAVLVRRIKKHYKELYPHLDIKI